MARGFGRARNAIVIFLHGGPSHLDLWDPKPDAPIAIRGDVGAIRTNVPGILLAETMPRLARQMDKCALIRSMSFSPRGLFEHAAAVHETLTGDAPAEAGPSGCVDGPARSALPLRETSGVGEVSGRDRERYGSGPFGASVLQARQAVESGARLVQVNWPDPRAWDSHTGHWRAVRGAAAKLDGALAALLEDLHAVGLLGETIVVAVGEFGRAPRLGISTSGNFTAADGRDHWPYCYTALVAGGGIPGGQVYGASDATGSYPAEHPVHPRDLLATIFHALGRRAPAGDPLVGLWS